MDENSGIKSADGSTAPMPQVTPAIVPVVSQPVVKPPLTYTQKVLIAVGISAAAVLLAILAYYTTEILVLCFAGILLAVFISAPADLMVKYARIKRGPALGIVLFTLAVVVLGGGYFTGYTVTKQTQQLNRTLPGALKQFADDMVKRFAPPPPAEPPTSEPATTPSTAEGVFPNASATASTSTAPATNEWVTKKIMQVRDATMDFFFSESFVSRAGGVAGGVVSSTFGIIGNLVVVMGVGLFFAINPTFYAQGFVKLMPIPHRPRTAAVLAEVGGQLQWWFVGQLCSMVSIALLTFIGLSILGVPMAATLAILAGLMNFVPNFGPLIAAAPAVLIAFAPQGDQTLLNPALAGWVMLLYVVIQLLEGWVITPFFQQRAVELPPALIIVSQVVFALLLGPIGLVLATPILAVVLVIVRMVYVEDVLGDRGTGLRDP